MKLERRVENQHRKKCYHKECEVNRKRDDKTGEIDDETVLSAENEIPHGSEMPIGTEEENDDDIDDERNHPEGVQEILQQRRSGKSVGLASRTV